MTTPTCRLEDGRLMFTHTCSHRGFNEDGSGTHQLPIGEVDKPFSDGGGWEVDVDDAGELVNVRPSIRCDNPGCGCHGFWTNKAWVPSP